MNCDGYIFSDVSVQTLQPAIMLPEMPSTMQQISPLQWKEIHTSVAARSRYCATVMLENVTGYYPHVIVLSQHLYIYKFGRFFSIV